MGMSRIVQEKFEVHEPIPAAADHRWVTDKSVRTKKGMPGREGRTGGDYSSRLTDKSADFNSLPPGSNLIDAETNDMRVMPMNYNGNMGEGGDRTQDVTATSIREGFDRKAFRPTDDMYSREHQDAFYEDVTVDGVTGFLERNNMLDRS
jgi:hypothetical protein